LVKRSLRTGLFVLMLNIFPFNRKDSARLAADV